MPHVPPRSSPPPPAALALARDERGAMAMVFALALTPVMLVTGMAVDYSRFTGARAALQKAADAAALEAASAATAPSSQRAKEFMAAQLKGNTASLAVTTDWASLTDVRVAATMSVARGVTGVVPGVGGDVTVGAAATARVYQQTYVFQPPSVKTLDFEAGDYNVISAYCYDETQKNDATTRGRTQFKPIADNGGSTFNDFPTCKSTETVSYMLRNVRDARANPAAWGDNGQVNGGAQYKYYSDTTINDSVLQQHFTNSGNAVSLVETVRCDNLAVCKPMSQGGVLPEGKNRTPNVERRACEAGKYMYYGFEDRPPGLGWTDEDYDDIRVIIPCPELRKGPKEVRLTK